MCCALLLWFQWPCVFVPHAWFSSLSLCAEAYVFYSCLTVRQWYCHCNRRPYPSSDFLGPRRRQACDSRILRAPPAALLGGASDEMWPISPPRNMSCHCLIYRYVWLLPLCFFRIRRQNRICSYYHFNNQSFEASHNTN